MSTLRGMSETEFYNLGKTALLLSVEKLKKSNHFQIHKLLSNYSTVI